MDDSSLDGQTEHTQISTALELEQLEVTLFRSKSLSLPNGARGVFGGQVISQALVAATSCVDPAFALHSMHCYFLMACSPSPPIVFYVDILRTGKSYVTCSVKAVQNGNNIFVLMCSFQKPEPWQPARQWTMPEVPLPDECLLEEEILSRVLQKVSMDSTSRELITMSVKERTRSPIAVKMAEERHVTPEGHVRYSYWMKARNIPKYEPPFQKCILGYISDLYFLHIARRTLGLTRHTSGPHGLGMMSSIDHAIHFYDDDFDCGDWLLYSMVSSRAASGRSIAHGQIYTREGKLIALVTQEGVIRADIWKPVKDETLSAKL